MIPQVSDTDIHDLAVRLGQALGARKLMLATAESCTGGWASMAVTAVPGSSDWFDRGFVTYSNQAKSEMLAVPPAVIEDYGAVSEAVATAMASGALRHSEAGFAIAVTGVAGPAGGSDEKPVGTVWIALASANELVAKRYQFDGDRQAIREATLISAIEVLLDLV